jgi:predicted nuclease of predicted toxin-antitoxin system
VVAGLQERGCDVRTVIEEALTGSSDRDVLARAVQHGRVVVTHDLSFGHAAVAAGTAFLGIIYLRPGHISPMFVLEVVDAVRRSSLDVEPPFVLVAERRESTIRVRVRTSPPW